MRPQKLPLAPGSIARAAEADVVVKASGVGVFDDLLLQGLMDGRGQAACR
jgi:hypothetical protein